MSGVNAGLLSVAGHRPLRSVRNADLPATLDTSDEWIRTRSGIAARGIAGEGESLVELAVAAGGKALAAAGVDPADIGLLLLASCTMPSPLPAGAPRVATALGTRGGALDLNAACAGFSAALALAADSVRSGTAGHALVIGAERFSDWLDWSDRGTAVLFGDGAGAAVVGPVAGDVAGIGPVVWGSDGSGHDLIEVPDFGGSLRMQGREVYRWATAALLTGVARDACAAAGITPADLVGFVPHQANMRIIAALARSLGLGPETVVADDVVDSGNTSAASIPLALARLVEEGRLHRGDPVLLFGFGAGLAWAAQVVRCP